MMRGLICSALCSTVLVVGLALPLAVKASSTVPIRGQFTGPTNRPATGSDAGPFRVQPATQPRAGPIGVHVAVGYGGYYRDDAWVPVRIVVQNRTDTTIAGTLEIPDTGIVNQNPPQPYGALYQMPVVLAGAVTKAVTVYLPAASVNGQITVRFRSGSRDLATVSAAPVTFDRTAVSIGALTADPANIAWMERVKLPAGSNLALLRLTPALVDPVPQVLDNFDLIVVGDGSVTRLDREQLSALDGYVRNGGTLLLVGGAAWQEQARTLPADLVPGYLTGMRTLPNLLGLRSIQNIPPPSRESAALVSVLRHPRGTVLAQERGVPLAVQDPLGKGQVLYLAFDPSLDPIAHWAAAGRVLTHILVRAAPGATGRSAQTQGAPPPDLFFSPFGGQMDIAGELSNVPAAALPSIVFFVILALLYVILLGPVNFLLLRRSGRRELLWVTVPVGAVLCMGATFGVARHIKGGTVLINTVSMVTLDGQSGSHPAALYMGLFAPVRGDYQLTFDGSALPQYVPQFDLSYGPGTTTSRDTGIRFGEGAQTQVRFQAVNMWSMRDVALHTTVAVPGTVQSELHIDRRGYIVGAVHNDTPLTLVEPAIIAGRSVLHLPDLLPEGTLSVRVKPAVDIYDGNSPPFWFRVYGQGPGSPVLGGYWHGSGCIGCAGFGFPRGGAFGSPGSVGSSERTLNDRLRNAVTQLPEAQTAPSLGEVLFVAWNEQPLGRITVDGVTPRRRDLNLVVSPLSVAFAHGPFILRPGTFGAHLVDIAPRPNDGVCCGPVGSNVVDLSNGGSATFQFDLPQAERLHFKHLWLEVDAGGAYGAKLGHVWDWRHNSWVPLDLTLGYAQLTPTEQFISPHGTILVKLSSGAISPGIRIMDIHRNLQIFGDGVAG